MKKRQWLLLLFLGSITALIAQEEIQFPPTKNWICREGSFELRGNIEGSVGKNVWLFLMDKSGNMFLQYPKVVILPDDRWAHFNVRADDGIVIIWAVEVDKKGNKTVEKWKKQGKWKGISQEKVEGLSGFRQIGIGEVQDLQKCGSRDECKEVIQPTGDMAIIADFELDDAFKGYPLNGSRDIWISHEDHFEVKVQELIWGEDEDIFGKYVLSTEYAPQRLEKYPDWRGGGLVIKLGRKGQCFDLSAYKSLEFEINPAKQNHLEDLRVKLVDPLEGFEIERPLKGYGLEYGKSEWQTVRIPLKDFSTFPFNASIDWEKTDLRQVLNLSFVGVIDIDRPKCSGTIRIDNIRLTK